MLSVIIPVYQVSDYIERCIRSVMAQTYTDIECVIVDDATQDDSIVKCENLIREYDGPIQFRIVHHEVNRGLSAARNTGTLHATGDYVYYLDGDDEITLECIEKLVSIAYKHPEAEMIQGNSVIIPKDRRVKIHIDKRVPCSLTSNQEITSCYHKHWIPTSAWNKLIKKSFLIRNNLMFKEGVVYEDLLWMFYVVKHLKYIFFCKDITYHYYIRPGSIVTATNTETVGNSYLTIYDAILNDLTPERERLELDGYVEGFCNRYMTFRKVVPGFDGLYRLYVEQTKRYGCRLARIKLTVSNFMVGIPMGLKVLQALNDTKTFIKG